MGFLTSIQWTMDLLAQFGKFLAVHGSRSQIAVHTTQRPQYTLTGNSSDGTTPTEVIDNGGVTFDRAIHRQVAAITCVRDLSVLENLDSHLHCIDCIPSVLQYRHGNPGSILTCGKVVLFICKAVKASPSMDEYCGYVTALAVLAERHWTFYSGGCMVEMPQ